MTDGPPNWCRHAPLGCARAEGASTRAASNLPTLRRSNAIPAHQFEAARHTEGLSQDRPRAVRLTVGAGCGRVALFEGVGNAKTSTGWRTAGHRSGGRGQAELIRAWKPWEQSTGPRTVEGKARSARNPYRGGARLLLRGLANY